MLRYALAVAGAVAMISNVALAETGDVGNTTTKVITHTAPDGMAHKKVIIKRHDDRYGAMVTKKKITREGMSGSSVTRTRVTTDPYAGGTVVKKHTIVRP
jgi:hypothetical protein